MTANRYVCIHGHYYQPPRENPWLEAIEAQASAYPYHDWNERVAAECYGPNGAARILGPEGRITNITNNYARTSFNFGPTLLSWLEEKAPETYAAVLEGDRQSRERFSGHGSAMAQVYNHMILPLANARDKRTQIALGHPRLRVSIRAETGGHVAAGDCRGPRVAGPAGGARDQVHGAGAAPGRTRAADERRGVAGRERRAHRSDTGVPAAAAVRATDRGVLLRRSDLAGGGVRGAAERRRDVREQADVGIQDDRRMAAAHAHRDGRRELRPPSSVRRDGAGVRDRPDRVAGAGNADQLRRVPGSASAATLRGDRRGLVVELRARDRALAVELRVFDGGAQRLEPGVAGAAAERARLAAGRPRAAVRTRARQNCFAIRGRRATPTSAWCSTEQRRVWRTSSGHRQAAS